jgi:hypothetical protein
MGSKIIRSMIYRGSSNTPLRTKDAGHRARSEKSHHLLPPAALARIDQRFPRPRDRTGANSRNTRQGIALTYDNVTLATHDSEILPWDAIPDTYPADRPHLQIPIISADMGTVKESRNEFEGIGFTSSP